jgi:hypothetical protein
MDDSLQAVGTVRVVKTDIATGAVIYDKTFKNQLTNYARQQSAALWAGAGAYVPSKISVGTGSPPFGQTGTTPNDTGLWAEVSGSRKALDYATTWLQYYTQYSCTYTQSEVLGAYDAVTNPTSSIALTEAGLWDASGQLWSHVALTGVTHDSTSQLSIIWQVLHNGN